MKALSAEQRAGLQRLLATLSKSSAVFLRHVLAIYRDDEQGMPSLFGTALVVEHRGRIFLVTAKHVLAPLKDGGDLYVYAKPDVKRHLGGQLAWSTSDVLDVGVLMMDGDGVPPFPEVNCEPLPSRLLTPSEMLVEGRWYFTVGYPGTKSKPNKQTKIVKAQPYGNLGPSISADRMRGLGLDPSVHIAITFHKKRVFGVSGTIESSPDPGGMSGSPLFVIYDINKGGSEQGAFQVAGTLIEYRSKEQVLLGTDIKVAIGLMNNLLN